MQGKLEIFRKSVATGEFELLDVVSNTILDTMYSKLVQLFGGEANAAINRIQFGTGATAAAKDQTYLQVPITPIKTVSAAIDPGDDYTVVFTAYLLEDEANGFPISEAGLLSADGILVTRITFTARTKSSSYQFGFRWSITVKT
jgi:hypothetical protein